MVRDLFYKPLAEFNRKKSKTVEDLDAAEERVEKASYVDMHHIAQRASSNALDDIVEPERVLKYAQRLDENGEYAFFSHI